jgi:hypothetical protein
MRCETIQEMWRGRIKEHDGRDEFNSELQELL